MCRRTATIPKKKNADSSQRTCAGCETDASAGGAS
jgi:hypothetical protein